MNHLRQAPLPEKERVMFDTSEGEPWFQRNRRVVVAAAIVVAAALVWWALPSRDRNTTPSSFSDDQRSLVSLFHEFTDRDAVSTNGYFPNEGPLPDHEYWRKLKQSDIELVGKPSVSGS